MNKNQISRLVNKIKIAREMGKRIMYNSSDPVRHEFNLRLKEISDKTDLARNDVIIKKAKLRDASKQMKKLEKQLDELLSELSKFQDSEMETETK